MARRGRCHRQRRLQQWSFSALKKLPESAWKSWLRFVCKGFPTLFQKDYEKDLLKEKEDEQVKSTADRFAGYKSICLFGLGSLFWGSATGYLGQLDEKYEKASEDPPAWMNFFLVYSAFALVSVLVGLVASTFPKTSWLAPSLAGFGSLQSLVIILGGLHVASLQYHPYKDECKFSMIASTIVITISWGLSVQDPLILHFLVKLIFWLPSLMVYGLLMAISKLWQFGKHGWTKVRTKVLSLKSNLMSGSHTANRYRNLPQKVPLLLP